MQMHVSRSNAQFMPRWLFSCCSRLVAATSPNGSFASFNPLRHTSDWQQHEKQGLAHVQRCDIAVPCQDREPVVGRGAKVAQCRVASHDVLGRCCCCLLFSDRDMLPGVLLTEPGCASLRRRAMQRLLQLQREVFRRTDEPYSSLNCLSAAAKADKFRRTWQMLQLPEHGKPLKLI